MENWRKTLKDANRLLAIIKPTDGLFEDDLKTFLQRCGKAVYEVNNKSALLSLNDEAFLPHGIYYGSNGKTSYT